MPKTLKAWRERFLAHREDVERIYEPRFVRILSRSCGNVVPRAEHDG
jgi:hypothetical protein